MTTNDWLLVIVGMAALVAMCIAVMLGGSDDDR